MEIYAKFVSDNHPAPIMVPWPVVVETARALGLSVEPAPRKSGACRLADPESGSYLEFANEAPVALNYALANSGRDSVAVVYRLRVSFLGGCFAGSATKNIDERLLEAFESYGPREVTVSLPERVVSLPVPEWVEVGSDDSWASTYSLAMFESEARAALDSFIQQAAESLLAKKG